MNLRRRLKTAYFVVEGINAFATMFYFSYLLFLLRNQFGFGRRETLALGAVHGLVYVVCAWKGGRLSQRLGYLPTLGLGFGIMLASLCVGGFIPLLAGQIAGLLLWTVGVSFTWPCLEALACEGEDEAGLPRMVGLYNLVWAGTAALGYFTGGAIFDYLGSSSLYRLPLVALGIQLVIIALALHAKNRQPAAAPAPPKPPAHQPEASAFAQPVRPETFLKMAWLANPFSYMAINTTLLIIPDLARQFDLSPTMAGVFCSVWLFTRMAAFGALWRWTGWHYRFRWLAGAFAALIAGFFLLLLAPQLWLVVVAQIIFGAATGLIYYSSLFYSMDVGEASQGEHGGLHEAAIGAGICIGPAIGSASLYQFPQTPHAGTWAVGVLLSAGFGALMWMRWRRPQ